MGVLDTQSIREHLANRKLGRRRLEQRKRARQSASAERRRAARDDRRRPGRGAMVSRRPQDATVDVRGRRRARARAAARDRAEAVGYVVGAALLFPVKLLVVLLQPRELIRRLREAPDRMRSGTRRLRMASRNPDTAAGRISETVRLGTWFVREEFADMQDGFPRPRDVAASVAGAVRDVAEVVARRVGLLPEDSTDDVGERLAQAAGLGFVAAAIGVGLFISTFEGIEAVKTHERLAVAEVAVLGLDRTGEADVLAALGVRPGDNLLELELDAVAARAERLPWIDAVTLRRDLRGQVFEVRVVEHRPVLLLAGAAPLRLVDDAGRAFKPLAPGDPVDLPVLTILGEATDEVVADAASGSLDVLHALSAGRAVAASDVSELRYEPDDGFTLVTRTGLPVRLGRRDFSDRLGRLERAVQSGDLPLDALASVDVGLRDRLVAVPLTTRKARRTLRQKVEEQRVDHADRQRMLHLQRIQQLLADSPEVEL